MQANDNMLPALRYFEPQPVPPRPSGCGGSINDVDVMPDRCADGGWYPSARCLYRVCPVLTCPGIHPCDQAFGWINLRHHSSINTGK
jgi:hypothetical protein